MFTQEGQARLTTFYKEQQEKKKEALNQNNEQKHLENFRMHLQNLELSKSKTNKDGTIPQKDRYMGSGMKKSMSPSKKQALAEDLEVSLIPGDANKSPDTSSANLLQKPSNNNAQAQKKPRPDSAATSSSEMTDKGNKKDLITKDNKQLNIKDNLLPTNQGLSPTSNSKGGGAGTTKK